MNICVSKFGLTESYCIEVSQREIFSKSYCIKLKSDCIYHFRLICNQTDVRLIPNQSKNGK